MDANEQKKLADLVVAHVADYRQDELDRVDAQHVLTWLAQFDEGTRDTILIETERLLGKRYISRVAAKKFIEALATNPKLAGEAPKEFWKGVGFLRLQASSKSQGDMLALLAEVLAEKFGLTTDSQESTNKTFVYLDDLSFSGNQIRNDLSRWVEKNDIRVSSVHVIVMAIHTQGQYYAKRQLLKLFNPRKIRLNFWASFRPENSPLNIKDAEVMWPTHLPDDPLVKKWEASFAAGEQYFNPRPPGGLASTKLFTSEKAREIVEQEFLKKGAYIYSLPQNPTRQMRPLGYSALRTPGFGATVATYRNCPNNAPLVMWWGNPKGNHPLNQWTPLLQRRPRAPDPGAEFDDVDI